LTFSFTCGSTFISLFKNGANRFGHADSSRPRGVATAYLNAFANNASLIVDRREEKTLLQRIPLPHAPRSAYTSSHRRHWSVRMLSYLGRMFLASIVSIASASFASAAEGPKKLNVLFLLGDDWRWDTLGCVNPIVKTPNLDWLAKQGVRFSQMRVTTSICCVSRASILSGQHMARHKITRFGVPIEETAWGNTYPAVFRSGGWWTGFVGKFGVGKAEPKHFDFLRSYEGVHWMKDGQGKVHVTEKNARDAMQFLKDRPKDRPFCLSLSFFAAHAEDKSPEQYLPQEWSAKAYEGTKAPIPPTATEDHFRRLPAFLATDKNEGRIRWKKRFDTPEKYQRFMINYYRLATEVDEVIGRLLEELERQGELDNTLIVFTGDNGYFHGEHGLADKWYPYEESLRVPLIVRDPRLPPAQRGREVGATVLNIDLPNLMLRAAGLAAPKTMQGEDPAPLYLSPTPPAWRDEFYYQHPVIIAKDRIPQCEAVVRRDAIYAWWPDFEHEQLFDLTRDPRQEKDVARDPGYTRQRQAMAAKLAEWREKVR
jgi:arylsulfatase